MKKFFSFLLFLLLALPLTAKERTIRPGAI